MKYAFYCDRPSVTCRTLARVMGLRKLDDSDPGTHALRQRKMRGSGWTIINYGTSYPPWWDLGVNWVNPPDSVALAVSKLATYNRLKEEEVKSVRITDQIAVAQRWVGDGYRVLTRRDGLSQGRGIQEGIVEGPGLLYSRVFPKTHEYRVFVVLVEDSHADRLVLEEPERVRAAEVDVSAVELKEEVTLVLVVECLAEAGQGAENLLESHLRLTPDFIA